MFAIIICGITVSIGNERITVSIGNERITVIL
jgi:hypothetical protein